MPIAPVSVVLNLISAAADPVSRACCSSRKFALGTSSIMTATVFSAAMPANTHGATDPIKSMTTPDSKIVPKPA
jgi:hypothetical protein